MPTPGFERTPAPGGSGDPVSILVREAAIPILCHPSPTGHRVAHPYGDDMQNRDESIWWDPQRTASYNALFNFIIGMRGAGKTYGSLKRCINRFLRSPENSREQFVYIRRHKTELKILTTQSNGTLFDAVSVEFPDHVLSAKGNVLRCDDEVIGYAIPLSTSSTLKSTAFPRVREIIFDEFIIDNTRTYHYLPDEVRKFNDAYETIARPGNDPERPDTRVWFLSNAVTISNPYFAEYNLRPPANGDIQRFGPTRDMLVQSVANPDLSSIKKGTRFGQMLAGSRYESYAYDNEWLMDDATFVERKTKRATYWLSLRCRNSWYGVWFDSFQGLYYISSNVNLDHPIRLSATTDDHMPNTMLLRGRQNAFFSRLRSAYENGWIRYESIKIKNIMQQDVFRRCY